MGARTLVAIRRPNGRFDCRYAHWGVRADPIAQSRLRGRDRSAAAVLAELDAGFDRLLVRGEACYCVCWLDPTLSDSRDIALAATDDPAALRAWWTEAKSAGVDAVADGTAPAAVRTALVVALDRRADAVHRPDDASFLRADS